MSRRVELNKIVKIIFFANFLVKSDVVYSTLKIGH